jgi:hypothetical protein
MEADPVTSFTVTPSASSVSYSIGIKASPSKGLAVFLLQQNSSGGWVIINNEWLYVEEDNTGDFTNLSIGTYRMALNYSDAQNPGKDPFDYKDVEIEGPAVIESFTVTQAGWTINADIQFSSTYTDGYIVGVYDDPDCLSEVCS